MGGVLHRACIGQALFHRTRSANTDMLIHFIVCSFPWGGADDVDVSVWSLVVKELPSHEAEFFYA